MFELEKKDGLVSLCSFLKGGHTGLKKGQGTNKAWEAPVFPPFEIERCCIRHVKLVRNYYGGHRGQVCIQVYCMLYLPVMSVGDSIWKLNS